MKKNLLLPLICLLFISFSVLGQKNSNANGDDTGGRTNLILPHGNIGIGTLDPSVRLEVIGKVRISEALEVQNIEVVDLSVINLETSEDILVGRNLLVEGNIGIGIQDPTEKLDINGSLRVSNKVFAQEIEVNSFLSESSTISEQLSVGELFTVDGLTGLGIPDPVERLEVAGNIKVTDNIITGGIQAQTAQFSSSVELNNTLVVSGNTGIGVENPQEKLEVLGNIKASGAFLGQSMEMQEGTFISNVQVGQNLTVEGDADFTGAVAINELSISNNLQANTFAASEGIFGGPLAIAGIVSLDSTLFVNGKIGVGTDNIEGYLLSVGGKIRSSGDIRVYPSTEWADFVFEETYQLRPLQELAAFIEQNNHLPEFPSAAEVNKEGIDLGSMDAKLLQKVEELTLYAIEQEEKINEKEERITALEDRILRLEKLLLLQEK